MIWFICISLQSVNFQGCILHYERTTRERCLDLHQGQVKMLKISYEVWSRPGCQGCRSYSFATSSRVCRATCGTLEMTLEMVAGYQPYVPIYCCLFLFNHIQSSENVGSLIAPNVWNRLAILPCAMWHMCFFVFECQVKPQERLSLDACISHSWISTVGGGSLSKILKSLGISSS